MSPLIISFVLGAAFGGCAVSSWWCFRLARKLRYLHEREDQMWHPIKSRSAPTNRSVIIRHKDGAGDVFDIAMYVGRQSDGEDRWVMGDIRLETKQITHWHEIPEYPNSKDN